MALGELLDKSHHRGVTLQTTAEDVVLAAVRETVAEVNPTSHATVTLGSSLDRDLALDSLVRVELLVRIEDALGVRLPERLLVDAETPRDLVEGVLRSTAVLPARVPSEVERPGRAAAELPLDVGTLVDALEWHASVHPDRVHVRMLGDDPSVSEAALSYATLRDRARSIAAGLAASDVHPGESVAVMLPTSVEYFAVFMGVLFAGAVPVPLYPPSRPAQLDDYLRRQIGILENAQATALVTTSEAARVARAAGTGRVAAYRQDGRRSRDAGVERCAPAGATGGCRALAVHVRQHRLAQGRRSDACRSAREHSRNGGGGGRGLERRVRKLAAALSRHGTDRRVARQPLHRLPARGDVAVVVPCATGTLAAGDQ